MQLGLLDDNVSMTMNVFLVIANIINLLYNIPQMVKTYRSRKTNDISEWFLLLRFLGNVIWVAYSIEIQSLLFLLNNCVTVFSSAFIGYFKVIEMYSSRFLTLPEETENMAL